MTHKNSALFRATGLFAITGGLIAVLGFLALKPTFGYPEIIRESPEVLLNKLYEQRHIVPYLYYAGVGGGGVCIFFFSILIRRIFQQSGEDLWSHLGHFCGIITGVLLYTGIIRYTFLFPLLAEFRVTGVYPPEMVDLVFKAFNTYVGDSIAEHVQFTFTSLMLIFFGISILKTQVIKKWIGIFGIFTAGILVYGNLEPFGAPGAFMFNRIGADLIAVWLICAGINLLLINHKNHPCVS